MTRVLVVEDEPGLVLTLTDRLVGAGYDVDSVCDGAQGLQRALTGGFDLVLLDVMLPGKSGFEICRELRRAGATTPVLMLTARGALYDKIAGFETGADDYLTKPFAAEELLARIEALLRRAGRSGGDPETDYRFGDVEVDLAAARVLRAGEPIQLSARLFQLLRFFIVNRGKVIARQELLDRVWGHRGAPSTRTVDVHVAWLRQRIEPNPRMPRYLVTVHGLGYKFVG